MCCYSSEGFACIAGLVTFRHILKKIILNIKKSNDTGGFQVADKMTEAREELLEEVVPTLFIALGGTGAQVLWRIRRRILNALWVGKGRQPVRLEQLTEFPFAEFLQIDLDLCMKAESGKAVKSDILSQKVRFKEEEMVVKKLGLSRYTKSDEELAEYPLIQEWLYPLEELNIGNFAPAPIRCISRLYFFDKYPEIRSAIRNKADRLMANVTSAEMQKRLGLKVQTGALKIVVVASTAGGTGSGSFLDLGYLSGIIGKQAAIHGVTTHLVLLLPTGYRGANLRTQANAYAALMELETCMRQGSRYIEKWNENEIIRDMPEKPYSDVYLIDTANVAGESTENITDIYDMVADALFDDFSIVGLANYRSRVAVCRAVRKFYSYSMPVDKDTYGDMKLTYSRAYSSFGRAIIDTHLDQKRNIVLFKQVNGMLTAFFGISSEDAKINMPTDQERDDLLAKRLYLGMDNEIIDYEFVKETEQFHVNAERSTYPIVSELLRVKGMSRLDGIEKKITDTFEAIRISGSYKEWPNKITDAINQINHDTFAANESGSGLHEHAIKARSRELLAELLDAQRWDGLIRALWARVDNKERGGLDYTIELIQRLKDRLENANTGLAKALEDNAKWFSDLSGHLLKAETSELQNHLQQAIGKFIGARDQSEAKLKQIADAVRLYVRYHLYAVASREAAALVHELSEALGKKVGTDAAGNPEWAGFVGELEAGRSMVRAIISDAESQISLTREAMKQGHAMYFVLPAPHSKVDDIELLPPKQAREWAEKTFEDFGGTQELFALLKNDDGRSELLGKLRNRALALITDESVTEEENPLFAALDAYPSRQQLFSDFLQRAMPWISAKLGHYVLYPDDPYSCFIGVKNAEAFEARYGSELKSRLPAATMMTAKQIRFVEIDTPGKLVCYVELSGLPIPALKGLDDWYTAYKEENAKFLLHTHKRTSTFVHPREWTTNELSARIEDFKLFVEAVALGVLRRTERGVDAGLYKLKIKGEACNVGDEKNLRQNGFGARYRPDIQRQVDRDLDDIQSVEQLAMWVAMLIYYQDSVYPLVLKKVKGVSIEQRSLPTAICERLVEKWKQRLQSNLGDENKTERMLRDAQAALTKWSEEIPGSKVDVYPYEVNMTEINNKRVLKGEVLQAGWTLSGVALGMQPTSLGHGLATGISPPPLPGSVPPPPPVQADIPFFIMLGSQQYGPYHLPTLAGFIPTGQFTFQSLVWRTGMADWMSASQVPELSALFSQPMMGMTPPPPPPDV